MEEQDSFNSRILPKLVVNIVSAYVARHTLDAEEFPELIKSVHAAFGAAYSRGPAPDDDQMNSAKLVDQTVKDDYIISMEDGRPYKSMKRHLASRGLTPEQYRKKWKLPTDYPMVAPSYVRKRAAIARSVGLGRRGPASLQMSDGASDDRPAP